MNNDQWGQPQAVKRNGQFQKGESGNPRGRPLKKERTYTHRQVRHDILNLMEREAFTITINGRKEVVPIIVGIYWRLMQKALEGDTRMLLEVIKLRREIIADHTAANIDTIRAMDFHEAMAAEVSEQQMDKATLRILNNLRKKTRDL